MPFDAFIDTDLGVFSLSRQVVPHIPLHVSTQANTTNRLALQQWKNLGAQRAVLARELTLQEIAQMNDPKIMETEIFIHGAMCVSYSGRCLLSNFLLSRDANHGDCAHPCRWEYAVLEEKNRAGEYFELREDSRGSYIMNSKDLCLLPVLADIVKAGADSLKIEGRNKSVYYVGNTVRIYRAALDALFDEENIFYVLPEWERELQAVGNRGYTLGFINGKPDESAFRYDSSESEMNYVFAATVDACDGEFIYLTQRNHLQIGDRLEIILPDCTNIEIVIDEMYDEKGDFIQTAPHPKQKIKIPCELFFPVPAIARRKKR